MAVLSRLANLILRQIGTPSTPPAGMNVVYPKSDGRLYTKGPDGVERCVGIPEYSTTAPANPVVGQLWYDSDEVGAQTVTMPTGVITPVGGATAPAGSLLCNGATFDSGTYPALASYLGDTHGVHSGTTYYLPDMRGLVPVGFDATATGLFDVLAKKNQGARTHQLTTAEMPTHNHTASTDTQGDHSHSANARYATNTSTSGSGVRLTDVMNALGQTNAIFGWSPSNAGGHGHNITVNNNGSGAAHNNLQPYLALNFVIWT